MHAQFWAQRIGININQIRKRNLNLFLNLTRLCRSCRLCSATDTKMTLFLNTLFSVDNIIQILILILCSLFSHSIYDLLFWFLFQTSFWVNLNKKLFAKVEIRGYLSNAKLKTESNRLLKMRCKLEKSFWRNHTQWSHHQRYSHTRSHTDKCFAITTNQIESRMLHASAKHSNTHNIANTNIFSYRNLSQKQWNTKQKVKWWKKKNTIRERVMKQKPVHKMNSISMRLCWTEQ